MKPDVAAVRAYLGSPTALTDAQLGGVLRAEADAQAARCRVPSASADWPDDLSEALCRRVARNLALRNLPLGVQSDELGSTRISSADPEIRRLEAPHRRLVAL